MKKNLKFDHPCLLSMEGQIICESPNIGDEIYCSGMIYFNVSAMLNCLSHNPLPIVDVPVNIWGLFGSKEDRYVEVADIARPILIAEIAPDYRDFISDIAEDDWIIRGYACIDGHHRIEKATRLGIKTLPAMILRMEQHIPFLYKGYNHYVNYWNGKLEDRMEDVLRWKRLMNKNHS